MDYTKLIYTDLGIPGQESICESSFVTLLVWYKRKKI